MTVHYTETGNLQEHSTSISRQFLYTHARKLVDIEALEVIIGPKIKTETKLMAVKQLISETVCIQQSVVVRNPSVPCMSLSAHGMCPSTCLDIPIRVVAVTRIWRQCRHRSTVLLPVSRSSMLRMAEFNLSSVPASSFRVGHSGLAGAIL